MSLCALNTKEYIVSVKEEIEYTKTFIEIEQIKYKNSFDVNFDIDENALNLKTIKLILQPIIENAFEHGIKLLDNKRAEINISVYIKNDDLIFDVSDNGVGMSAERLKEVREALLINDMPNNKHIGLCNVNQRIKLIFGDNYGCHIESNECGTTITLNHPASS